MNNLEVFTTLDYYWFLQKIKEYQKSLDINSEDILYFDIDDKNVGDLIRTASIDNLFESTKLVVINNLKDLVGLKATSIQGFIDYAKNPNSNSYILIANYNPEFKLAKEMSELKNYILFIEGVDVSTNKTEYGKVILTRTSELIKENNLITTNVENERIIYLCNGNLFRIENEIIKLRTYLDEVKEVTLDDINLIISDHSEEQMYSLTENYLVNDRTKAFEIYQTLLKTIEAKDIYNYFVSQILMYQKISTLKLNDLRDNEIAEKLGISTNRLYHINKTLSMFPLDIMSETIEKISLIEVQVKRNILSYRIGLIKMVNLPITLANLVNRFLNKKINSVTNIKMREKRRVTRKSLAKVSMKNIDMTSKTIAMIYFIFSDLESLLFTVLS